MSASQTVPVIDEENATLTMFRLFLKAYGYSVLTMENGATGLQLVRALNLEATDFINKPIGRSALDAALRRAEARLKRDRRDTVPGRQNDAETVN